VPIGKALSVFDVSGSGLSAQRLRMALISQNIANANSMRGENGEPFRRKEAIFSEVVSDEYSRLEPGGRSFAGVRLDRILTSSAEFKVVHNPSHPLADKKGFVKMPNIDTVVEMSEMISASRSYEANLAVMKSYKQMLDRALGLLR